MAYLFSIGAIKLAAESTFGTKSGGSFEYLETLGRPSMDLRREYFEDDALRQTLTGPVSGIIGHHSESTLTLTHYVHGYDSAAVNDAPALPGDLHPDARTIGAALGGMYAGGYDAITGATSTVSNLVLSDASSFVDGQVILVNGEVTWVLEATTGGSEELALGIPLAAIPAGSEPVYGSINAYAIDGYDATYAPPYSWTWHGAAWSDMIAMLGTRPNSLKLSAEAKGFLTAEVGWNVVDWDREDSGGAPTGLTYDYPSRIEWVGGKLVVYNITTDTRTEINATKAELDCALALAPITDPNADDGVSEWQKTGLRPTLTVDPLQTTEDTDEGWGWSYSQGHKFAVTVQVGTAAGKTVAIVIPYCELIAEPGETDRDGFVARTLTFGTLQNTRNSTQTADTYTDADPADKEILIAWI